jgi:hypothetical protein
MDDADIDVRLRGKTYVVGVGVQKAGTTWLHDYLAGHPEVFMSERKELHYFDKRFGRATRIEQAIVRQLRRQLEMIPDGGPVSYTAKFTEIVDMLRMQYDDHGYAAYFAQRAGANRLFGEVTPSYCMIGEDGFHYMKSLFPRIKVIYLMRDPLDRHHSLMRMTEEDRGEPGFAQRNFLAVLDRPQGRQMADYRHHVESLRAVFTPEELFIGFYETLFNEPEIRRLCEFLGIPFAPASYETRLNTSRTLTELDAAVISAAMTKLEPTYSFCREAFPELPPSWRA